MNKLYVNKGLMIFPVIKNGKTPIIQQWQKECSSNYMQILYWIEHSRDCNWGMPATPNNLFIIDLDRHDVDKDGVVNFEKLLSDIGVDKCETLIQKTPSGGLHYIFKSDDDLKNVSNSSNIFENYSGIDCRSDGYIVVNPSTINGNCYEFINDLEPQKMPKKLKDYILNNVGTKTEKRKTPYIKPKDVVETGDRDNQIFGYINNLYYKTRLDYDEIVVLAKNFNETMLDEPFTDRQVLYKVKKAFEKERPDCILVNIGDGNV